MLRVSGCHHHEIKITCLLCSRPHTTKNSVIRRCQGGKNDRPPPGGDFGAWTESTEEQSGSSIGDNWYHLMTRALELESGEGMEGRCEFLYRNRNTLQYCSRILPTQSGHTEYCRIQYYLW